MKPWSRILAAPEVAAAASAPVAVTHAPATRPLPAGGVEATDGGAGHGSPVERARPILGTLRRWTGILSAYFTAQTLTQATGLVAGLLLVRFMPVQQFALYTLATSVVTFFTFVSDLGSTSSLLYFFQRSAATGEVFQPYLGAVLSLRRGAFVLGAAAVLLVFPRSAAAKGFGALDVALVTAALLLCVWLQIAASVRLLALRLGGHYGRSYRAEVAGGAVRLATSLLMVAASLLRAWLGMLGMVMAGALTARLARPAEAPASAARASLGPYRRRILRYLLPTLPSALYFSIQGPLVVWLAATFGGTKNIAEVGALGRLGLVLSMFSGLSGVVLLPRMARIVDERLYRRRYFQYGGLLLAIALGLLAAAVLFPGALLFVLGKPYSGLHRELALVTASAGLTLLSGFAVGVNLARSWNRWQTAAVLVLVAAQTGLASMLPLTKTAGVLLFSLLSGAVGLALQLAITEIGFRRPHWVHWAQ
jgi:O-antigen/teichoic acid export membrane protein